jgi:transposase
MAQNFLSCDRGQAMLLPASVADWLPEGHLARFVVALVERLDLRAFYAAYRADGCGRAAHDPAMMVALVLYSYAVGVRSSRAIERRCVEDVACRFVAANRAPDHVTINRFRSRFADALSGLFGEVLGVCARAGMVRVGVVAIDSTKLAADASLGANRTYEGLRAEAARILEEAAAIDAAEDELYGEARGDELPEELADPHTRAGRIRELLDELERERE